LRAPPTPRTKGDEVRDGIHRMTRLGLRGALLGVLLL